MLNEVPRNLRNHLVFMKKAKELIGLGAGTATFDLDEAVVVVLDLDNYSLRVGVTWPRKHRNGDVNGEGQVGEPVVGNP